MIVEYYDLDNFSTSYFEVPEGVVMHHEGDGLVFPGGENGDDYLPLDLLPYLAERGKEGVRKLSEAEVDAHLGV